ncbi:MAG: hypothetical protein IJ860_06715 [Eubacterium sp.]|nr:hypothetical protein [Eubacterium sp.]
MAENISISEYNAFGPWVYEITESHPVPRLFAPFFNEDDQALMKIKIPREIDRRNATPDMDLYDYVIALYEDQLRILERQDNTVKGHTIYAHDFMGIRVYKNLLIAACTVFSSDGATSFSFNTVSIDVVEDFVELAIKTMAKKNQTDEMPDITALPVSSSEPESMLIQSMLHKLNMKRNDISQGALQNAVDVYRKGDTATMIERMVWKEMNPEALHLYTDKDLIILENGFFPNRAGMPDFGYTYTVIPLNKISGVEITESQEYSLLNVCTLYVGPNRIKYHYDIDNEEVTTFYEAIKNL